MDLFTLHHFIQSLFITPINGIWIALFTLIKIRSRVWVISCLSLSGLFIYAQYTPLVAVELSKLIYPSFDNSLFTQVKSARAIVVLGAGSGISIDDLGQLHGFPEGLTLLNVESAAVVARNHPRLPVILSGGFTNQYFSEAGSMQDYLQNNYTLLNKISVESQSLDTDENARYTAEKLAKLGVYSIILVTQASHMWRSVALFNKYNIKCIEYPAWDLYNYSGKWWQSLFPDTAAANQTRKMIHEVLGYAGSVVF